MSKKKEKNRIMKEISSPAKPHAFVSLAVQSELDLGGVMELLLPYFSSETLSNGINRGLNNAAPLIINEFIFDKLVDSFYSWVHDNLWTVNDKSKWDNSILKNGIDAFSKVCPKEASSSAYLNSVIDYASAHQVNTTVLINGADAFYNTLEGYIYSINDNSPDDHNLHALTNALYASLQNYNREMNVFTNYFLTDSSTGQIDNRQSLLARILEQLLYRTGRIPHIPASSTERIYSLQDAIEYIANYRRSRATLYWDYEQGRQVIEGFRVWNRELVDRLSSAYTTFINSLDHFVRAYPQFNAYSSYFLEQALRFEVSPDVFWHVSDTHGEMYSIENFYRILNEFDFYNDIFQRYPYLFAGLPEDLTFLDLEQEPVDE